MARNGAVRLLKVVGLVGLVALVVSGCSIHDALSLGWPEGITPQAARMRELWIWAVLAALIVGGITAFMILWPVAFHRKRSDELPRQFAYNMPLEIVLTAIPVVIVLGLFYFTVTAQNYVTAQVEDPDVRIEVVGFQWNWEFRYLQDQPNADGEFPVQQAANGEGITTVGSSSTVPLLVVPTDRVVEYHLVSRDVLHSFYVPEFLFKRDVFPYPEQNDTDNVFQTTVDQEGAFVGRCAELCGTYHSMMNFEMRALPPDLFEQYMSLRAQVNPATGDPYTAGEALERMNCGELCAPAATTTSPFGDAGGAREAAPAGTP